MRSLPFFAVCAAVALLLAASPQQAGADSYSQRQYYEPVYKHPKYNYSYRAYYYKPTPTYAGYKHHYAIYVPSQPKYVYFYNPYKRQYWGRCPAHTAGKAEYSLLPPKDRKGSLKDIPESAFPDLGSPPPIPESNDGAILEMPPDDLPGSGILRPS
jgi:hypothetical protein